MSNEIQTHINEFVEVTQLYTDVCRIIDDTRNRVAIYVNSEVCLTNWRIGKRIKEDILFNKRAEYGKQIVKNLSVRLTERYGKGWSEKTLRHCLRSAETFSENEIVSAVQRQFSWTSLKTVMYISDPLARQFYMQMCLYEHWSTRTLEEKIDSQLYERTVISRRPEEVFTDHTLDMCPIIYSLIENSVNRLLCNRLNAAH